MYDCGGWTVKRICQTFRVLETLKVFGDDVNCENSFQAIIFMRQVAMPQETICLSTSVLEADETPVVEADEEAWEKDLSVRLAIAEAHPAYQTGQYVTIDEYLKINGYVVC